MRILVLGASGMLGHMVVRLLGTSGCDHRVIALSRTADSRVVSPSMRRVEMISGIDAENSDALLEIFARTQPECVVNCIGLVKQRKNANDPLVALPINAILPNRLAYLCNISGARLIHISTDCVFNGARGNYREDDLSDATDLYGKSKFLGEVAGPNAITLRTSIIGHELRGTQGLIEWFLAQEGSIRGYRKVIFSGLPTVELARIIRDVVLPRPQMSGVYHVASAPISKYELLTIVAKIYGKVIDIEPDDAMCIDRSLNGTKFQSATGYVAPEWNELVQTMYAHKGF